MNIELISLRSYAKQCNVSPSYISKLVKQGKIVLHDGKIDPSEADQARQRFTRVGRGQRRWERRHPEHPPSDINGTIRRCAICEQEHWIVPTGQCQKCGRTYTFKGAVRNNRYRSADEPENPDPMTYCSAECAGVPKPKPEIRMCAQCGDPGGYRLAETWKDNPDPSRFCDRDCAIDAQMGKSREMTRQRLLAHLRAYGYTDKALRADEYGWLLEKPAK